MVLTDTLRSELGEDATRFDLLAGAFFLTSFLLVVVGSWRRYLHSFVFSCAFTCKYASSIHPYA